MDVGAISSLAEGLTLPLAIQGAFKAPGAIARTRYVDAAREATGVDRARPATPSERVRPGEPDAGPERITLARGRSSAAPVRGTAYQTNGDGDSVTLTSRLADLTGEERIRLAQLQSRDTAVRVHEQAHAAAAGGLQTGGPSYTYKTGPDGSRYATGGCVRIDTTPGATPEETIAKAQRIRQAALAPGEPSSQDRAVAARASRMEAEARVELRKQRDDRSDANGPTVRGETKPTRPGTLDLVA